MLEVRFVVSMLTVGMLIAGVASSQSYPNKSIRVVTAEPGGGTDFTARTLGQAISGRLGQRWVVDNRGGAGGSIAAEIVAKSPPDGYTLLVYTSNIWIIPLLREKVAYDVLRDLAPISLVARSPNTLVVHPSLPVTSVKELIALVKAKPGQLNYASSGTGASTHLSAELFKAMAGVDIVRIAYKGNAPALTDVISGQVQLMFSTAAAVAPHVKSGRLRALAITSTQPSELAPGLPTVAASGLPGYESMTIYGVYAPAGTATTIITKLNEEIVAVLRIPEVKQQFNNSGVETVGSTPQQFLITIKADIARMGKVIKDAGIREE